MKYQLQIVKKYQLQIVKKYSIFNILKLEKKVLCPIWIRKNF